VSVYLGRLPAAIVTKVVLRVVFKKAVELPWILQAAYVVPFCLPCVPVLFGPSCLLRSHDGKGGV
jgi:hypothetical protein